MLQQEKREAPRPHYGQRSLIDAEYGKLGNARAYGKGPTAPRGSVTLPEAWSIVCPNRIAERRRAAGYEHVSEFHRALGSISYQRLVRMEIGRVIIRDSEYELVADLLGLHEDDLKLPLLTQPETLEWSRKWGARKQVEEGGDEDSVVLAAYVRRLVGHTGRSRTAICQEWGFPGNCLAGIWHAEKPIDRWPDTTMGAVIRLAKAANWDDVVTTSMALHADNALDDEIAEVVKPRVRYAPEDPDRKAPWTYEADPFRTRKGKRQVQTPVSAEPMRETAAQRGRREKAEKKQRRADHLTEMRRSYAAVIDEARTGDQTAMIEALFPDAPRHQVEDLTSQPRLAAMIIARVALVRLPVDTAERQIAADLLGVSIERIRQIANQDDGRLATMLPRTRLGFKKGFDS